LDNFHFIEAPPSESNKASLLRVRVSTLIDKKMKNMIIRGYFSAPKKHKRESGFNNTVFYNYLSDILGQITKYLFIPESKMANNAYPQRRFNQSERTTSHHSHFSAKPLTKIIMIVYSDE